MSGRHHAAYFSLQGVGMLRIGTGSQEMTLPALAVVNDEFSLINRG
jgi:hypothetical protein